MIEDKHAASLSVFNAFIEMTSCRFLNITRPLQLTCNIACKVVLQWTLFKNPVRAVSMFGQRFRCGNLSVLVQNSDFLGLRQYSVAGIETAGCHPINVHVAIKHSKFLSFGKALNFLKTFAKSFFFKLDNSVFINNQILYIEEVEADHRGAAVLLDDQLERSENARAVVSITNSVFQNNTSGSGGALSVDCGKGVDLAINNCTFVGNKATLAGGAIEAINNCRLKLSESRFVNNSCIYTNNVYSRRLKSVYGVQGIGGALALQAKELDPFNPFLSHLQSQVVNTMFQDNVAEYSGGSIYTSSCILTISDVFMEVEQSRYPRVIGGDLLRCKYRCRLENVTLSISKTADSRIAAYFGESSLALEMDSKAKMVCPKGSIFRNQNIVSPRQPYGRSSDIYRHFFKTYSFCL